MKLIYRCNNDVEATIILHALVSAGVPAFDGEKGTSAIYPMPNFGPTIYVKHEDAEKALKIIKQLEIDRKFTEDNESFHDVNHKEIEYLSSLNSWIDILQWILLLGIILVLLWFNFRSSFQ